MKAIIETDRMILRKFSIDDYQSVYEFGSNVEVQKYTGDKILTSPIQAKIIIKEVLFPDYKKYGYGRLAAIFKPENKIIGFAGLKYLPECWGKGIATEVSIEIIRYGFEILKLENIIGIADPINIGSYRVLEKIGLKFYKLDTYDEDNKKYNWYQLSKEEYLKK